MPSYFYKYLVFVGVALCGLGLLMFLLALVASIRQLRMLAGRFEKLSSWFEQGDNIYTCRAAHEGELPLLRTFAMGLLGENVTPLETMEQWYRKNPNIFHVIYPQTEAGNEEITAFFSILPLSRAATKLVEAEILNGINITAEHLVSPNSRPASIYIGGIAGVRWSRVRGAAVAYLHGELSRYAWKAVPIFTRPVTSQGLDLLKRYKFKPVKAIGSQDPRGRMHKWSLIS
jgi:hypothetical protein